MSSAPHRRVHMRAHLQSAECWGERGSFGPESLWLFQGRKWGGGMTEEAVLDQKNKLSGELGTGIPFPVRVQSARP